MSIWVNIGYSFVPMSERREGCMWYLKMGGTALNNQTQWWHCQWSMIQAIWHWKMKTLCIQILFISSNLKQREKKNKVWDFTWKFYYNLILERKGLLIVEVAPSAME